MYERLLRVRSWKPLLPDGGAWFRRGFPKARLNSRSPDYLLLFAAETRRGEWAHWVMLLTLPLFGLWNTADGMLVVTIWLLAGNLPCIVVQRYNRARLLRVIGERGRLCYTGEEKSRHDAKGAGTMKLFVAEKAASWYKQELALSEGDHVRLFVRMGGCGSVVPGLSLGIMRDEPRQPGLEAQVEGVNFYIEQDQLWYLDNRDLHITFDPETEDIQMDVR